MPKETKKTRAAQARKNTNVVEAATPSIALSKQKVNPIKIFSRMMQRAMSTINTKIGQLEQQIKVTSSTGSSTELSEPHSQEAVANYTPSTPIAHSSVAPIYYPMSHVLPEKPKFPSKNKHPVTFIEDLMAYLKKIPPGAGNVIDLIIECLEGETRNWARIYKDRWVQLEDFKRDFLDTYWGEAEQNNLRRQIVHNTWDSTKSTMLSHFITLCGQAKMLTYPIQERQLISDIMHHFPSEVQYAWATSRSTSILEATEFLRKLDDINKQTNLNRQPSYEYNQPSYVPHSERQQHSAAPQQYRSNKNNFNRKKQYNNQPPVQQSANVVDVVDVSSNNESAVTNDNSQNLN
uniref:Uncharacterized protein n=1 Tax=Pectinophora gossypiella TaxID=13191 RepID=A0A1E1WLN5_PECGO